jgi:hypothetical protein
MSGGESRSGTGRRRRAPREVAGCAASGLRDLTGVVRRLGGHVCVCHHPGDCGRLCLSFCYFDTPAHARTASPTLAAVMFVPRMGSLSVDSVVRSTPAAVAAAPRYNRGRGLVPWYEPKVRSLRRAVRRRCWGRRLWPRPGRNAAAWHGLRDAVSNFSIGSERGWWRRRESR